jgi:hypothetical protein
MISNGLIARAGDTIPYVICKGESSLMGKRAYHIQDIEKGDSTLEIGKLT